MLALDLGDARIGVALSDPERTVALPHGTIRAVGGIEDIRAVAALVQRAAATDVVVGHPLTLAGTRGSRARQAEAFAEGLRALLPGTRVHLQDERLTTVEAERELRRAGAGRRTRRAVDQVSATLILRAFLERAASER